ncbi:dihydrolipoamide acetyltransferase family protein [Halosegnis sp.]|uniref:dihydrolipoamide acetyltransferase family protein n=1 Tax=Halosegnis sp. TaxID=2864959 RepID=UPI0035D3E245
MVREFKLPDVGEGLAEAEIVNWLVSVGDRVTEDQPVAEVETDKAVVEVPSPVNGTVREIRAEEGEVVPVGEVIITFDTDGDAAGEATADREEATTSTEAEPQAAVSAVTEVNGETETEAETEAEAETAGGRTFAAPSARRLARELDVDLAAIDGSGPGGRVTEADVRAYAEGTETGATTAPEPDTSEAERREPATTAAAEPADRDRTLAAPATRQLADELGVNLDSVPTEETREGEPFVTPEQVREFARAREQPEPEPEGKTTAAPAVDEPTETEPDEGAVERVPYRGIRRTIGEAMERSAYTAPHVTHHEEIVVERLVETRERLKPAAEAEGSQLTYLPFIVKAVVAALEEHPILNSQLDEENEEILLKQSYNIGIAVATEAGLMVPVVKNADQKGLLEIADEVSDLAAKARDRSIERTEMQDGTFSVTNFGAVGGEYATPIINYPETAILGLGALKRRPVVEDGEVVARQTLPLSLSIDHRVIDGADAARFVETLAKYLQTPERLLL